MTFTLSQSKPSSRPVGQRLGRECLVDLDQVERLDRHLDAIEEPADALDRGEEQPLRLDLGLGIADDPGEGLEAVSLDGPLARDDGGRGTIGDAGRVAGGDGAAGRVAAVLALGQGEDGLESGQRLDRRVTARALVDGDDGLAALGVADGDRRDLGLESARVDGRDGELVAAQREFVLVLRG